MQISSIRRRYLSNTIVIFDLNQVDTASGPAYRLNGTFGLKWYQNMSCSYVVGQGMSKTSILIEYPRSQLNASVKYIPLYMYGVKDLIIADLTVDRANSSWLNYARDCLIASNYGYVWNKNYSAVENSSVCQDVYHGNLALSYGLYVNDRHLKGIEVSSIILKR